MAYFPLFMELENRRVLVVGGGNVALRKIEKLLSFGPKICVVAPEICTEIREISGLDLKLRAFVPEDLSDCEMVIAATGDRAVNRRISETCRQLRIPVNVVDSGPECSFYFPALVRRGRLSIGICTGGSSPAAAAWIRRQIEDMMPEGMELILDFLNAQRRRVRTEIAEAGRREALMKAMFAECVALGRPLLGAEIEELRQRVLEERE